MIRKTITWILATIVSISAISQSTRYVDRGLLRMQSNLAFGKQMNSGGTNMYVVGDLDYHISDNISITSGVYYFLGSYNDEDLFKDNHSAFIGASYHFKTNTHFDPYVGILPRYSINRINAQTTASLGDTPKNNSSYPLSFNPLISVNSGVNYYANRFFNLFINVKYQTGKHFSDVHAVSLNEVKFTFGLGYTFWARKNHFKFRKPGDQSEGK